MPWATMRLFGRGDRTRMMAVSRQAARGGGKRLHGVPEGMYRNSRSLLRSCSFSTSSTTKKKGSSWEQLMVISRQYPDAVQLGQGYPDYEGSRVAREAAAHALLNEPMLNQYSASAGLPRLVDALIGYYQRLHGIELKKGQITTLTSGTEGLYTAINSVVEEGDEVLVFQPCFPWYPTMVKMCGGKVIPLNLSPPSFAPEIEAIEKSITEKTRVMLLNTPHNPTGHTYTEEEIKELARIAKKHDLWVISDEVYENVTWNDSHHRISQQPGMFERCITIGSASKLFSLTGWRLGWATAPEAIIEKMNHLHSHATYCAATPLQYGVAVALEEEDGSFEGIPEMIAENYRVMSEACSVAGLDPYPADGGHFLCAGTGDLEEFEVVERLVRGAGVMVLPLSSFACDLDSSAAGRGIRIAICKKRETMAEAAKRLKGIDLESGTD